MARCPHCGLDDSWKNGYERNHKSRYECKGCGRQFNSKTKAKCRICSILLDEMNRNQDDPTLCMDEGLPYSRYSDMQGEGRYGVRSGMAHFVRIK